MIRSFVFVAALWCVMPQAWAQPKGAAELAVDVVNRTTPVLCAEKDNVQLDFVSPDVRAFRVQAVHPAYINTLVTDRWAPDWSSCDMSNDPSFAGKARRVTFWETPDFWLVGYTFDSFWRPGTVPFRVGDRVETGLHLVQLWTRYRERAEEILVLYPPDGYWRARPLPFADLRWTAYGSSFLVGPVEVQERPMVALKSISFDPAEKSFRLEFSRGGSAVLKLVLLDQDRIALDVAFDGAMPEGRPFASLRSMYAAETNSDVAKVAWRAKGAEGWGEAPITNYPGGQAAELWAGRTAISRHNLSAPDHIFSRFSGAPK